MTQAVGSPTGRGTRGRTQRRQRVAGQMRLAVVTLVLGLIAAALAWFPAAHLAACVFAFLAAPVGFYTQLVSETTEVRCVTIIGLTGAGLGLLMGIAHGGFS
jgi:hypothetical protein